jgi:hypothetical protein
MAGKYRYWLICIPSINPDGLVLFTENDTDGGKIRDYSVRGSVREVQRVLPHEVPGVFRAATKRFSVEPFKTTDDWHWRNEIQKRTAITRQPTPPARIPSSLLGSKGSQCQIQRWVGERQGDLLRAIGEAFPAIADVALRWVSPLASESFREYRDREFLQAIGQDRLAEALAEFWPSGGPQWDALAIFEPPRRGVILVEAKAYPEEAENRHCKAEGESLKKISLRLDEIKAKLGAVPAANWIGTRYQVANRLAHLYFLRSLGVPAWYVQICFCDDTTHRPTTAARWRETLPDLWKDLGLPTIPAFVADLLLPALERDTPKAAAQPDPRPLSRPAVSPSDTSIAPRSILDGTDAIITAGFGILRDKASSRQLDQMPSDDAAVQLVEAVIDQINRNWSGKVRGSGQNWRWCPVVDQHVQGGEVGLQKTIVKYCGAGWVNAIPAASGLMPAPHEEKQRNVDLGFMRNETTVELIELKLAEGHQNPVSAALQLLQYACLYLHARRNAASMTTDRNGFLMEVRAVCFQVLSFHSFYRGFDLSRLEQSLHDGLSGAAVLNGLTVSFQFTHFPAWFAWNGSNIEDLQRAANGRLGLNGPLR